MIISERIFEIMKEQKMSQRELSRRTGITISTISGIPRSRIRLLISYWLLVRLWGFLWKNCL